MCGIFGFFSFQAEELKKIDSRMQSMMCALAHRGPDDSGYFVNDHVGLGNTRLAILGIGNGHQPMFSKDGTVVVVQNGEIYNYIELQSDVGRLETNCDTEIILKMYEKYGVNFVSRLNGMFAIALYDQKIDTLFLYRDRIGEKPLYIYDSGDVLFFSSEIKPILYTNGRFKMNYAALDSLLTFNYVVPPMTMYENVRHLLPGHGCVIRRNRNVSLFRWWDLSDIEPNESLQEKDCVALFQDLLRRSVKLSLASEVPYGAFLSGGVDSSSVVGYMSQISPKPVETFSIGFDDIRFDESIYAEEAARRFGAVFHLKKQSSNVEKDWYRAIWHCEQPHGDFSFIPTLLVSEWAREHGIKVILTGDGGDELFGGYEKYLGALSGQDFETSFAVFQNKDKKTLTFGKFNDDLSNTIIQRCFKKFEKQDKINQLLAFDTCYLLPGNNLVKPDRMGLAAGIEARSPFLDYRMVEFAFAMKGEFKIKEKTTKYIYRKAVKDLIGEHLAYRTKQMFTVPVGEWFRISLKSFAYELLNRRGGIIREILNLEFVNHMFQMHCEGRANYTRQIRLLLALQIWWEQFQRYCEL